MHKRLLYGSASIYPLALFLGLVVSPCLLATDSQAVTVQSIEFSEVFPLHPAPSPFPEVEQHYVWIRVRGRVAITQESEINGGTIPIEIWEDDNPGDDKLTTLTATYVGGPVGSSRSFSTPAWEFGTCPLRTCVCEGWSYSLCGSEGCSADLSGTHEVFARDNSTGKETQRCAVTVENGGTKWQCDSEPAPVLPGWGPIALAFGSAAISMAFILGRKYRREAPSV